MIHHRPYWPLNNHDTPSKPSKAGPSFQVLLLLRLICSTTDIIEVYRAPHPPGPLKVFAAGTAKDPPTCVVEFQQIFLVQISLLSR
jgi:hypothetical protein